MWPKSTEAALIADRTYLRDYAGWVSSIHGVEARALVAAIRQADDRNLRKALSTRLMQSRVSALLSIGFLYVAVRERFGSSLLQARLRADAAAARTALREASLASSAGLWRFLRLPEPSELRQADMDPAAVNEYVDSGEQRLANLARIGQLARQDMLLSTLGCWPSQPHHRGVAAQRGTDQDRAGVRVARTQQYGLLPGGPLRRRVAGRGRPGGRGQPHHASRDRGDC